MYSIAVINGHDYKVTIPEKKLQEMPVDAKVYPLRGFGYMMAVFVPGSGCVGYIDVCNLGFDSVKEFLKGTNEKD